MEFFKSYFLIIKKIKSGYIYYNSFFIFPKIEMPMVSLFLLIYVWFKCFFFVSLKLKIDTNKKRL